MWVWFWGVGCPEVFFNNVSGGPALGRGIRQRPRNLERPLAILLCISGPGSMRNR